MNVEAIAARMALSGKVPRRPTRRQSEAHMILLGHIAYVADYPPTEGAVRYALSGNGEVLEARAGGRVRMVPGHVSVWGVPIPFRQIPKRFWWPLYEAATLGVSQP